MGDTGAQVKLAALTQLYQGDVAATEDVNRANVAGAQGEAAQSAAGFSAAGSLLGGFSSAANSFGKVNWAKIF